MGGKCLDRNVFNYNDFDSFMTSKIVNNPILMHIIREKCFFFGFFSYKFHLNDVDVECKKLFTRVYIDLVAYNCGESHALWLKHMSLIKLQKGYLRKPFNEEDLIVSVFFFIIFSNLKLFQVHFS